jgi:hypothetical protein
MPPAPTVVLVAPPPDPVVALVELLGVPLVSAVLVVPLPVPPPEPEPISVESDPEQAAHSVMHAAPVTPIEAHDLLVFIRQPPGRQAWRDVRPFEDRLDVPAQFWGILPVIARRLCLPR